MDLIIDNFDMDVSFWKHLVDTTTPNQCMLACMYLLGLDVEKDDKKGLEIIHANPNCSQCVFIHGCYYEHISKNMIKALQYYQQAMEMENAYAINSIAYQYQYGLVVDSKVIIEQDLSKAIDLYKRSADMGCVVGIYNLGHAYNIGWGVEKDIPKAIELYERGVEMGYSPAMTNLGIIYSKNPNTMQKAIKLFERAVELENETAMNNLGLVYDKKGDFTKAMELYQLSAERGSCAGICNLAYCYAPLGSHARGIEKDINKAIELYEKVVNAEFNSLPLANAMLGKLYEVEFGDFDRALDLYKKGVEKSKDKIDDAGKMQNLRCIYEMAEKYDCISSELYIYAYENGYSKAGTKIITDCDTLTKYINHLTTKNTNRLLNNIQGIFDELLYAPGMKGALKAQAEFEELRKGFLS